MIVIFLLSLVLFSTTYTLERSNVVVLDFTGDKNSEPEQLAAISNKLEVELISTKAYKILDRSQMDLILQEQGFQQTGACNSSECQVEIGQLLGVEKMITGTIVYFGDLYSITLQIINVGTGEIEQAFSYEIHGSLSDVLTQGCKQGARLIAQHVSALHNETPNNTSESALINEPTQLLPPYAPLPEPLIDPPQTVDLTLKEEKHQSSLIVEVGLYTLSAIAMSSGAYFHLEADKTYDIYNDNSKPKSDAQVNDEWDTVRHNTLGRAISYGVGAALLAGAISYTLFL